MYKYDSVSTKSPQRYKYSFNLNNHILKINNRQIRDQRKNMRGKFDKIVSLRTTNHYQLWKPTVIVSLTLDYFSIADVKESSTDIVIFLEEKNEAPCEYSNKKVESKGFYDPVVVQDFPIRGKKLFLNIRRRRWIWKLVAEAAA